MALSKLTGSFSKYEPLPRCWHISSRVGSKVVVQGGRTKDFSEKSRQHLSSVVEIFDLYSESWEQRPVTGDGPSPGTYSAASASLHDNLFSFGGYDGSQYLNTLRRLNTEKLCWSQVSPQNADGAPMPKSACGMIAFWECLVDMEYHEDLQNLNHLSSTPHPLMAEDGLMGFTSTISHKVTFNGMP